MKACGATRPVGFIPTTTDGSSAPVNSWLLVLAIVAYPFAAILGFVAFVAYVGAKAWRVDWKHVLSDRRQVGALLFVAMSCAWIVARTPEPLSQVSRSFRYPAIYPVTFLDFVPFLVAFFILSRQPFLEAEMRRIHWAVLATVPLHFLIGSLQWFYDVTGHWIWMVGGFPVFILDFGARPSTRISAGFYNPNGLGFYAVLCLIVGLSLLTWYRRVDPRSGVDRRRNHLVVALLVVVIGQSLAMLLRSGSRNAYATVVIALFVLSFFIGIRKLYLGAALAVVVSLVLLAGGGLGGFFTAVGTIVPSLAETRLQESRQHWEIREAVFQCAVDQVRARPWAGHGFDTMAQECEQRLGKPVNHAHNVFLQIASELGLPFTIACTLFLSYVFLATARDLATTSSQAGILPSGLFVAACAVPLMSQLALVIFHSDKFNILFWVTLAAPYSVAVGADGSSRRAAGSDVFHPYNPPQ